MSILSSNSPILLPREIMFEILSYLPVKSLLRFKCVCKHWNGITQDFRFICLHYGRIPVFMGKQTIQSNETDEFKFLFSRGLILEYATRPSHLPSSPNLRYRLRNPIPEVDHPILEIPDSEKPILNICLVVDPDNHVLKLLSVVYDDELIGDHQVPIGYEVLDLWNEESSSYTWRPLNLPQQSRGETRICKLVKKHTSQIKVVTIFGTAYTIWDMEAYSHIGIDIVDMVNDSYIGHTTLPSSFYTKDDCKLWKDKLSFAKIVKEELHVLMLDVKKKQQIKWGDEKLIIKLPFLKDVSVVPQIKLFGVSETNKLYFFWRDKESMCSFDTGKLIILVSSCKESEVRYITGPSLSTFKGMYNAFGQIFKIILF